MPKSFCKRFNFSEAIRSNVCRPTDRRPAFISPNENTVLGSLRNSDPFLPGDVASPGCNTMFRGAQRTRREENCPRTNTVRSFIRRRDESRQYRAPATSRIIRRGFESAKLTVDLKRGRKRRRRRRRRRRKKKKTLEGTSIGGSPSFQGAKLPRSDPGDKCGQPSGRDGGETTFLLHSRGEFPRAMKRRASPRCS